MPGSQKVARAVGRGADRRRRRSRPFGRVPRGRRRDGTSQGVTDPPAAHVPGWQKAELVRRAAAQVPILPQDTLAAGEVDADDVLVGVVVAGVVVAVAPLGNRDAAPDLSESRELYAGPGEDVGNLGRRFFHTGPPGKDAPTHAP